MAMSSSVKHEKVVKVEAVKEDQVKKQIIKEEKNEMESGKAMKTERRQSETVEPKEEAEEKKDVMADHGPPREYEHILWTQGGQLKLPCVQGCDGVLENDVYGELAQKVYQIEGLPRKMECKNPDCDSILERRKLCFYCPLWVIKGTNHVDMVWCRFCAYQKARAIHKKFVTFYNLSGAKARFDKSVIIYGFGSISGLR